MRFLSLTFTALVVVSSAGCLSPVDAFVGGYAGPLSNVGAVESSVQTSIDAPVSAPVVVDFETEFDSRFAVSPSSASDAILSGLLDDVIASTNLADAPDCHIPLTLREGRLVLDDPWPCDSSEVTETFDGSALTFSTDLEVTVTDLEVRPGRGDAAVEVVGTVEVDVVFEQRNVDQVQREFSTAVLSFTHLGRHVAKE